MQSSSSEESSVSETSEEDDSDEQECYRILFHKGNQIEFVAFEEVDEEDWTQEDYYDGVRFEELGPGAEIQEDDPEEGGNGQEYGDSLTSNENVDTFRDYVS